MSVSLIFSALALPASGQTSYYWEVGTPGNVQSNWGVNTDGTGASPGNFSTVENIRLRVQDGQNLNNFTGNWAVTGTNSQVVVESGGTITASGRNHNIVLNMDSGGTYEVSSFYSNLQFNSIDSNSTFVVGGSLTTIRSDLTYGSLNYNSSAAGTDATSLTLTGGLMVSQGNLRASGFSSSGTHDIGGNVTVQSGAAYQFGTTTNTGFTSVINVGGGLNNSGDFSNPSSTLTATLNFNGTGSSEATWGTHSGNFSVNIDSGKTIVFNDSLNTGTGSLTVDGTLSGTATAGGVVTLTSDGGVTFSDGSVISLALGSGTSDTLALAGLGSVIFDADQGILFLDDGATTGIYENIITGLDSDPGVAGWTLLNDGWSGTFSFDGANVDFNLAAIPEPRTTALALAGLVGTLALYRRRRRA